MAEFALEEVREFWMRRTWIPANYAKSGRRPDGMPTPDEMEGLKARTLAVSDSRALCLKYFASGWKAAKD